MKYSNHDGYNHFTLVITVSTKETDFTEDKMFGLIANVIRNENDNRFVIAYPPNKEQEAQASVARDGESSTSVDNQKSYSELQSLLKKKEQEVRQSEFHIKKLSEALLNLEKEKEDEIRVWEERWNTVAGGLNDAQDTIEQLQSELSKYKALAEGYTKLLKIASCPEILIENPDLLFGKPTPEDINWAEDVVRKYESSK